jgi:hypothetical protein
MNAKPAKFESMTNDTSKPDAGTVTNEPTQPDAGIPVEVLTLFARFDGRRACEADVSLAQNPYRGSGQEHLADAWEDSWLDTMDILRQTEA